MNLTPQQSAFVQALESSTSSLVLEAVAGSGKTTTMVAGANALPPSTSIIACAFNRRIADTLQDKMPPHALCKTMNGLGHKGWGKMLGRRLDLQQSKTFQLCKKLELFDFEDIMLASRMAKSNGYVPEGAMGQPKPLAQGEGFWETCIDDHSIDTKGNPGAWMRAADELVRESIKQAWEGTIDFDDQIYMPAVYGAPMEQADLVLIDEAQDIAPIQHRLLKRMTRHRLAAVGDRHQAIYGFRGASYDSLDRISDAWNCQELPLTVCFRCPKEVVREAQKMVPHIEWAEGASEGLVKDHKEWDISILQPGDAILCRNNKPIIAMAFNLLRRQVRCTVLGRDIGKNLVNQVKKIQKRLGTEDLQEWRKELDAWTNNEQELARRKYQEAKAGTLEDRRETLHIFADNCGGNTVAHLIKTIEGMFSDTKAPITLSTIHKAKGLEWPRVFFLDPHLLPAKFATTVEQKVQENNLIYVGVTRALEELHYINTVEMK